MRKLALLLVLALGSVARAQQAADYAIDVKSSTLVYHVVHKMHKVDGVSHKVEGKARITPDGKAQVMVRVPSESFDSGNVNRDAHMKEAVEAAKFPWVELKALGEGLTPPATFPTTTKKTIKAQLSFHGQQQVLEVPVEVTWESPQRVRANATFEVSLDGFHVERPSLMFVKVDDGLKIDAKLTFQK